MVGILASPATELVEFAAWRDGDPVGERRRGPILPRAHYEYYEGNAEGQCGEGHDPSHPIEAGCGGSGDHGRPVFLHEALQDEIVVIVAAFVERGLQLVAHLVGVRAADVIAFEQYLAASADAHHSMAEIFEARGIVAGAHENKYPERERGGLRTAANGYPSAARSRSFAPFGMTIDERCRR